MAKARKKKTRKPGTTIRIVGAEETPKQKRGEKTSTHFTDGRVKPGALSFGTATPPGFSYTSGTAKTGCGDRKTCPVQLISRDGEFQLRFCPPKKGKKRSKVGYVVRVTSAKEAQRIAAEACRCWFNSGKTPQTRSFDKCSVSKYGLGSAGRRRRS